MNKKGILIVVSAPSGCGKSTILARLMDRWNDLRFSISATTRAPRGDEQDGKEYYFVTEEKFAEMIEAGEFLEYAEYSTFHYGTPRTPVVRQLEEGHDVYLDIEVKGAMQVKEQYPEALLIFLMPPSLAELRRRLISRGTDSMEVIERRLRTAEFELGFRDRFDFVVVNDALDRAVEEVAGLIVAYREKMQNNSSNELKIEE